MPSVEKRVEELEKRAKEAEEFAATVGVFGVGLVQSVLQQLIDERRLSQSTASNIMRRVETDLALVASGSERMARSARQCARVAFPKPVMRTAPDRPHRETLRPVGRKP